ncbi:ISNCY family transposase [Sorangium sp. So ce542]|uniref:ISNCY family transposase n=1 Tax=Sorangium sp. So ce542 TaxID=3133316 RepID=UPI003F5E4D49
MRKAFFQQRPLVPPSIEHPHARELQTISAVLEQVPAAADLVLKDLTGAGIDGDRGRQGLSAEQVLRVLLLKQMHDLSYEELEFHLADSVTYRAFCGFGMADRAPSKSTLQRNIKALSEQTLEAIHRMIVAYAIREGVDDGKRTRIDSTVVSAAIHEPSDSSLLKDSVRVLTRLLRRARRWVKVESKDHRRAAKRRSLEIKRARSAEERQPLYRDLIRLTEKVTRTALRAVEALRQVRVQTPQGDEIDRLIRQMQYYVAAGRHVIEQTRRRVLEGEVVPAQQKIVSIFEPHVDVIVKDNRETMYGHKVFFSAGKSGVVFDVVVPLGNPTDSSMAVGMVERHIEICGKPPHQAAFDGGFTSRANLEQVKGLGVRDVAFSKGKGIAVDEMTKNPRLYRALRNFRAGVEATISFLKRSFGLDRCDWRTFTSFKAYVLGSVLAANLLIVARASAG